MAKPGARAAGIALQAGALTVSVRERAVDGAANEAVRKALAAWLGVGVSRVTLESGAASRRKRYLIEGLDEAALRERLLVMERSSG